MWALLDMPACKLQSHSERAPLRASKPLSLVYFEDVKHRWSSLGWYPHSSRLNSAVEKVQKHPMWVTHWIWGQFFTGISCTYFLHLCTCKCDYSIANKCCSPRFLSILDLLIELGYEKLLWYSTFYMNILLNCVT